MANTLESDLEYHTFVLIPSSSTVFVTPSVYVNLYLAV